LDLSLPFFLVDRRIKKIEYFTEYFFVDFTPPALFRKFHPLDHVWGQFVKLEEYFFADHNIFFLLLHEFPNRDLDPFEVSIEPLPELDNLGLVALPAIDQFLDQILDGSDHDLQFVTMLPETLLLGADGLSLLAVRRNAKVAHRLIVLAAHKFLHIIS
jgi:hypothetical protein